MFNDDEITCYTCGELHTACSAHNRQGLPCGRLAMKHLTVCNVHGGHSPKARRAQAKREAADIATRAYAADPEATIAVEGIRPQEDPIIAMGKLATASAAMTAAIGARLNMLQEDEVTWTNRDGVAQVSGLLHAYERSLDRSMKFSDMLVKAGFMERQLQLDEYHAAAFNTVLTAILADLALTPEQRQLIPTVVPKALRALEPAGSSQSAPRAHTRPVAGFPDPDDERQ